MNYALFALLITVSLFFGTLILLETGRRIGNYRLAQDRDGARAGIGAIDGAVFALLGLLMAFTFSGAASRFDLRRDLIVEEMNAIGTAYLRLDLLTAGAQPALRDLFGRYVDSRLEVYRRLPDIAAAKQELAQSAQLQSALWEQAVAAVQLEGAPASATMLLLPALNQMIDITTTRTMMGQLHPPPIIYVMLFGLTLAGALLAGYEMAGGKSRNWLHMLSFAAVMAIAVYVILDIEYPRLGLVQVSAFDQALVELRQSMK